MEFKRDEWIAIIGQADSGKTYWIRHHITEIPSSKLYIYDFNVNDYQDFKKAHLWDVEEGSQKEIEAFMKEVYAKGNCFAVFEESDNYFLYPSEFIRRFVNTARNRGIGAMVNCKRAKSIQPVYRNRFTSLVVFRTTIPEDIIYMEQWAGVEKGELEYVRNLPQGDHIHVDLVHGNISEIERI